MYNGSFTSPPCEENVTYIISGLTLMAPFDQILKISKTLIKNGNYNGNNRGIQAYNNFDVYHYKKSRNLELAIKEMDLLLPTEKKENEMVT
jgi:carbonic anhydrase